MAGFLGFVEDDLKRLLGDSGQRTESGSNRSVIRVIQKIFDSAVRNTLLCFDIKNTVE